MWTEGEEKRVEEGRQSNAKYKRFSIQGKTCMEVDKKICEAICDRESSIVKCSKITITKFNENSSGSKCEPDSSI